MNKFAIVIVTPEGTHLLPSLFRTEKKATEALNSLKLEINGYRGLLYSAPYNPTNKPIWSMAL